MKPKPCRHCRQPTVNKFGLTILCNPTCAIGYANTAKAKKIVKERKSERKETKAGKERIKPLSTLCAEARRIIQKFARLRDAPYRKCICCGTGDIEQGGHHTPVGSKYRSARFSLNPRQIHGCCIKCNKYVGGGNRPGYDAGLLARYGPGILEELADLKRKADHGEDAPLSKEEVREIKTYYNKLNRDLAKQQELA